MPGDLLVFYAGLEGWGCPIPPALYLVGYFRIEQCGFAPSFSDRQIREHFAANFHVKNERIFAAQR
ncbi:MAG: hypothetical protein U1E27_08300, partial [Kiritimatiellia bacterium]|nr:hypothetical protein [Kiritimatiellia bacterium]